MGNHNIKQSASNSQRVRNDSTNTETQIQQINSNLFTSLSEKLFTSSSSHQSTYSASRPWSRVSRRRWKESTLSLPYSASRTAWPVSQREACFLPEFPLDVNLNEDNFNIIEEIAKGTYGKVYKVEELGTQNLYALKVIKKSDIVGTVYIDQVKSEVQIQKVCGHHIFIASHKYHWQNPKNIYIASDFIEGGELYHLVKKFRPLPDILVQLYIAEIAVTIDFLHNAGIIHRDLKLENILLDAEGHIKLIDFGFSKWLSHGSKTRTICGSKLYMAPEVASNQPYGHAADWWSLGVIACAMMCNKMPTPAVPIVEAAGSAATDEIIVQKRPGSLPENVNFDVPKRDLLLRLLEIEPTKRLRSLRTLQTIAYFKGFDIADVAKKNVNPNVVLAEYFTHGPPVDESECAMNDLVENFSSVIIDETLSRSNSHGQSNSYGYIN